VLISSSRRHPCPVCGRQKNSSCRWGEKVIFCFCGDDHHPPLEMRTGETLHINGNEWALVATDGGHSGNSFVFRPHSGPPRPPQPRAKLRKQQSTAQLLLREVMAEVDAALAVPEFMHSLPDELRHGYQLIAVANAKATALQSALKTAAKQSLELREQLALLGEAVKQLRYQQQDASHFRRHHLGEKLP
jgi:hypothetical protein